MPKPFDGYWRDGLVFLEGGSIMEDMPICARVVDNSNSLCMRREESESRLES